jgi:hypothetical protein
MTETTSPADGEAILRIINVGLRPHAPTIALIGFSGDVVVALHEPGERAKARARALGWDGKSEVFRLTPEGRRTLAGSAEVSDAGIAKWLGRKFEPAAPVARIYVLTGDDSVLLNFSPFGGWTLEAPDTSGQTPS